MKVWRYTFEDGEYILKEDDVITIIHAKNFLLFNCVDGFVEINETEPHGTISVPFKLNKSQLKKFLRYMARGNCDEWVYK